MIKPAQRTARTSRGIYSARTAVVPVLPDARDHDLDNRRRLPGRQASPS
ncbi:hypothetical protein QJS66_21185 [Kocuria rhizophila]|nr:hypothetical protein QJS66_21185 [Kocuria rhizophila]